MVVLIAWLAVSALLPGLLIAAPEKAPKGVSAPKALVTMKTPATVAAERRVLLVDDFNAARHINLLGGEFGGDTESPGTCQVTRVVAPAETFGGTGASLRLDVDVSQPNSFSFLWIKLGPVTGLVSGTIDLSALNYLSFWVKTTSGRERIKVELHEDTNQDGTFVFGQDRSSAVYLDEYLAPPIEGGWRKAVIPLAHFRREPIQRAIELVLTFEHSQGNRQETVFVDEGLVGFHPDVGEPVAEGASATLRAYGPVGPEAGSAAVPFALETGPLLPGYRVRAVNPLILTTDVFRAVRRLEAIAIQYAEAPGAPWRTIAMVYQPSAPIRVPWVTAGLTPGEQYHLRAAAVTLDGEVLPLATIGPLAVGQLTEEEFLEEIERKSFEFFWAEYDSKTGLFADTSDGGNSSIASCGFGLTALVIGAERGWVSREEALTRALKTITTFLEDAEGQFGFFYHFLEMDTATRAGESEVSTIDTALALCGMLAAGEYFGGEVKKRAEEVYRQVEWPRFLDTNPQSPNHLQFSVGWVPGQGLLKTHWDYYSDEAIIIALLAIGSPTHPVPGDVFYAWPRKTGSYDGGRPFVYSWDGGLFTYQYAHAWFDFRDRRDREGTDWWQNSIDATLASRQFTIDEMESFATYGPDSWGITSYSLPTKYTMHHGAFPNGSGIALHDGTIAPSGPAGSLPFTPELSLAALKHFYYTQPQLWGEYGLKDAFNLKTGWVGPRYYGLGAGIMLLMIENYRSGLVWRTFMQNQHVQRAMGLAGFTSSGDGDSSDLVVPQRLAIPKELTLPTQPLAGPRPMATPTMSPGTIWWYAALCLAMLAGTVGLFFRVRGRFTPPPL